MSDKKCLSLFDVTGIQEFVFGPKKLTENIGGSYYVQRLFEEKLIDILKHKGIETDWESKGDLKILSGGSIKGEIVYIGGGNAMVIFDSKTLAVEVTKVLSVTLLEDTQSTLGVAVAHLETDLDDFQKDRKELSRILQWEKARFLHSVPLRGISITEECADGLPTKGKKNKDKNYVSETTANKQKLAEDDEYFDSLLPSGYSFPKQFDDLGQKEGESHIAVIHIDGNSMGRFIDDEIDKTGDYSDAVSRMRKVSLGIKELYRNTFKEMLKDIVAVTNSSQVLKKKLKLKGNNLPIRPIILSGDDVTFVCDGRIGLQLAARFLKTLSEMEIDFADEKELSACAGIAIVKSHFPFHRAYELAEELCSSAKKKAKALMGKANDNPGCWMDYHIVYSGFHSDLDALREKQYNIRDPKKKIPTAEYPQYHLLLRPFCVAGHADAYYQWEKMTALFMKLAVDYKGKTAKTFPRSRLKQLRDAFITSKEIAKQVAAVHASRDYTLPEYEIRPGVSFENQVFTNENQTPYFEPLELLDFYIPELELGREDGK